MNAVNRIALASLIVAAPSLVLAQKPAGIHTTAPVVKSHAVVPKTPTNDAAEDATKRAGKIADKTENAEEKSEHLALHTALSEHRLDKGLKLTAGERRQWETIEKNYDKQYHDLRKTRRQRLDESAPAQAARIMGNIGNKDEAAADDAAFNTELSSLEVNERNALRATLTPQQQTIFDANVTTLSKPKH